MHLNATIFKPKSDTLSTSFTCFEVFKTANFRITLGGSNDNTLLIAFTDSDFAACLNIKKSVGGYIIFFINFLIMWSAKKHNGLKALSSCESELVQSTITIKEILWAQPLIIFLGYKSIVETRISLQTTNQRYPI